MTADKIKNCLPNNCLWHVLNVESDTYLKPDRLTQVIDVYMNSHVNNPSRACVVSGDSQTGKTGVSPGPAMTTTPLEKPQLEMFEVWIQKF